MDLFDPEDEAALLKKEAKLKDARARELEEIQLVCSTKQGRKFYWRLLSICHIYKSSFTGNNTTFFNEGERNIGIQLMADLLEACPEMFLLMQKENAEALELERMNQQKEKDLKNG